jgi:hypothetical protein
LSFDSVRQVERRFTADNLVLGGPVHEHFVSFPKDRNLTVFRQGQDLLQVEVDSNLFRVDALHFRHHGLGNLIVRFKALGITNTSSSHHTLVEEVILGKRSNYVTASSDLFFRLRSDRSGCLFLRTNRGHRSFLNRSRRGSRSKDRNERSLLYWRSRFRAFFRLRLDSLDGGLLDNLRLSICLFNCSFDVRNTNHV